MTDQRAYDSPQAMRRAVTDRLKSIARPRGRWALDEMQRQFAYDRLLARMYVIDEGWILKGAVALLARQVSVRHSIDIDVYRDAERAMVERELRAAAELDLGDWFAFQIGRGEERSGGGTDGGSRRGQVGGPVPHGGCDRPVPDWQTGARREQARQASSRRPVLTALCGRGRRPACGIPSLFPISVANSVGGSLGVLEQ